MVKAIAVSIMLVCLISTSSFGGIVQRQAMDTSVISSIILPTGPNARAATTQSGLIANIQGANNAYGTTALQGQGVIIGQRGRASGVCGGLTLTQSLNGGGTLPIGTQSQRIGDCCAETSSENQAVGFAASQVLAKTSGAPGRVSGTQDIKAAQAQYATNSFMKMGEGALVIGKESASITGGTGIVSSTMVTDISQAQKVTN